MKWQLTPQKRIEFYDKEAQKWVDYCEGIVVEEVKTDLFSGKKKLKITVTDMVTGDDSVDVPRGKVGKNIIPLLADLGLSLIDDSESNANIQQIVFESATLAPHTFSHDRLGFWLYKGKLVFFAHKPIGISDPLRCNSEYILPKKTASCGDYDGWKQIMIDEVVGHPHMELALAIGVLAPVAHLLREDKLLTLVPIISFIGASSTGKTTCMKLMASVYGSPEESRGLLSDLNSTQNAFFAQLGCSYGLPALLDECSAVPEWDFTKVVYNLPKGKDKLRCDSEGKVRKSIHFSGAIILSGEHSLFEQTNQSRGLYARLIELSLMWTDDGAHADRIDYGIRHNYGTAVYPLITWLLANNSCLQDSLCAHYNKLKSEISTVSGVEDRLIKVYAAILVSAEAIDKALGIKLDIDGISRILLEQHMNRQKLLLTPDIVLEELKNVFLENYDKFPTKEASQYAKALWGEKGVHNGKMAFWVKRTEMERIMNDIGVDNFEEMKARFHEAGWLYRTPDRHYRIKHKIGTVRVDCYCVFYDYDASKEVEKQNKLRGNTVYQGSHLDDLLSEVEE